MESFRGTLSISVDKFQLASVGSNSAQQSQLDSTHLWHSLRKILDACQQLDLSIGPEIIKLKNQKEQSFPFLVEEQILSGGVCPECHQTVPAFYPKIRNLNSQDPIEVGTLDFHLFFNHCQTTPQLVKLASFQLIEDIVINIWRPVLEPFEVPEKPMQAKEILNYYFNLLRKKQLRVYKGFEARNGDLPDYLLIHGALFCSADYRDSEYSDFQLFALKFRADSKEARFVQEFSSPKLL